MDTVEEDAIKGTITDQQAEQLKEADKFTEHRGAAEFNKKDMAFYVLGKSFDSHIEKPTEGQILMAKMLATPPKGKEEPADSLYEFTPRPAGYAIGLCLDKDDLKSLNDQLFGRGMMILTSPVEENGKLSFVGADKEGLKLIKPKGGDDKKFAEDMRRLIDNVGDQEDRFHTGVPINAEDAEVEIITGERAALLLKKASDQSMKAPFVSTKDYERMRPKKEPNTEVPRQVEKIDLAKVDF